MEHFLQLFLALLTCFVGITDAAESKSALVIIDVQDCFLSGGSLAVTDGNDVIPVINKLRQDLSSKLSMVVVSQDWHCANHISFATSHHGKNDYDTIQLTYRKDDGKLCTDSDNSTDGLFNAVNCHGNENITFTQALWPVHCVKNVSVGPTSSSLGDGLITSKDDVLIRKGTSCEIDAYSLFFDNGGLKSTGLEKTLRTAGITQLFLTGLALDYCVKWTALDAAKLGFAEVYVVLDATRGVADQTSEDAKKEMVSHGIKLIQSTELTNIMDSSSIGNTSTSRTGSVVNVFCLMMVAFVFLMK